MKHELHVHHIEHKNGLGLATHLMLQGDPSRLSAGLSPQVRDAFPSAALCSVSVWPFQGGEASVLDRLCSPLRCLRFENGKFSPSRSKR